MNPTNEEQLLKSNTTLVDICYRLSQINTEQNQLLREELKSNTRLFLYCMMAYDIISQKENRTEEENNWLKKVRQELKPKP